MIMIPWIYWIVSMVRTYLISMLLFQGLNAYLNLFPEFQIADLYQSADQRPRQGSLHCPALTTGCARMWLRSLNRFAHGCELLLLHGIPVTLQTSDAMGCREIRVGECTHRIQCRLAGNSMHSACIGLMAMIAIKGVTPRWRPIKHCNCDDLHWIFPGQKRIGF